MSMTAEQLALFSKLAAQKGLNSRREKTSQAEKASPLEFPMTDVQRAYWIGRTAGVMLSGVASHGYQEFDCGALDVNRLQTAWNRVIARHDMLRAIVSREGMFRILPVTPPFVWEVEDLRSLSTEDKNCRLEIRRQTLSHRVPDLSQWPVILLGASLVSDDFVRIHLSCDAVMADVYSLGICLRELGHYYKHPDQELPQPGMTFGSYVEEIKKREQSPLYQQCRAYWQQRLTELPLAPQLPLAENKPEKQRFQRLRANLRHEEWAAFKALCGHYALTPSVVLFAAFSAVVGQWARQSDFCLNVTLFNRESENPAIENVVGDFTSTMLTAARSMRPGEAFVDYARALDAEFWRSLEHSAYSGVRVLQDLSELHRRPLLMPIVFTSAIGAGNVGDILDTDNGVLGKASYTITQTPQIWLDHQVLEENCTLVYNWDVVDGIFEKNALAAMFESYGRFVAMLAAPSANWLAALEVPLPETQVSRRKRSEPEFLYDDRMLHQGFLDHAEAAPEKTALIAPNCTLTYGELYSAAASVAQRLQSVLPEETKNVLVAVALPKSWQQIAAVLGVMLTGAAYVPIDPDWPLARRLAVLTQGISAAIVEKESLASDWADIPQVTLEPEALHNTFAASMGISFQKYTPDRLAYVIFTSGTTGTPKGVMMSHEAVQNTIHDINSRFAISSADSVFALSALSFDLSVYDIFGVLGAGGHLVLPACNEYRDPSAWVKRLGEHPVTLWNSVPALWQMFVEYGEPLNHMPRLALLSGDWIPIRLAKESMRFSPQTRLVSLGGATEAAIWSIAYPMSPEDPPSGWRSIPYGKALAYQTVEVLHENLTPCPDDVTGELFIGGRGLALGYLGDAALTASKFIAHPQTGERLYRTGDLGRWRSNGQIEFLGRRDTQVKIGGFRIELGEVEAALSSLPGVAAAVADVRPVANGADALVAYIVPQDITARPVPDDLRTALRAVLPAYMVPQRYLMLDRLPLSGNGKVDRKHLPVPSAETAAGHETGTELEERIREIIARHLGITSFGLDEKFFDLGATSLLMVKIHRDLNEALPKHIALIQLFETPSVRTLARAIEGKENDATGNGRAQAEKRLAARTARQRRRGDK